MRAPAQLQMEDTTTTSPPRSLDISAIRMDMAALQARRGLVLTKGGHLGPVRLSDRLRIMSKVLGRAWADTGHQQEHKAQEVPASEPR